MNLPLNPIPGRGPGGVSPSVYLCGRYPVEWPALLHGVAKVHLSTRGLVGISPGLPLAGRHSRYKALKSVEALPKLSKNLAVAARQN